MKYVIRTARPAGRALDLDADADGWGATDEEVTACTQPSGYVSEGGDCNDSDPKYHPDAPEDCSDPNDYNCDGSVGYADNDGDGVPACQTT